jgi:hypothetical protein
MHAKRNGGKVEAPNGIATGSHRPHHGETFLEMAEVVVAAKFSGRFSSLNEVTSLTATRPDIIRSLLAANKISQSRHFRGKLVFQVR